MKRHVEEFWDKYADACIPSDLHPAVRQRVRESFFTGAFCVLDTLFSASRGPVKGQKDEAKGLVDDLTDELREFAENAFRGTADDATPQTKH